MVGQISHINPIGLMYNPAVSQAVMTSGRGKTVYIGGQNSINADREIVGKGDLRKQTEQAMQNIQIALEVCGATFVNIVKLSINIVQGQNLFAAFQVLQKNLCDIPYPPAISVALVAGLINPDFLIEIEAVAFIPE